MAAASESPDEKTVAAKAEQSTKESPDPSSSINNAAKLSSKFGSILIVPLLIAACVVGAVSGAFFASQIIESEYREFMVHAHNYFIAPLLCSP